MDAKVRSRPRQIEALGGARILVALNLIFYHFAGKLAAQTADELRAADSHVAGAAGRLLENAVGAGYLGTAFFFVLSGFVLCHRYADDFESGRFDVRGFAVNRLSRIYPLYVLSFCLMFAPMATELARMHSVRVFLAKLAVHTSVDLTLLQAWTPFTSCRWNFPTWSLSAELFFYALFPFAVPRLMRLASSRRRLVAAMVGLWVVSLLPGVAYWLRNPDGVEHAVLFNNGVDVEQYFWIRALKFTPALRAAEFLTGIALALLYRADVQASRARRGNIYVVMALALVVAIVSVSDRLPYPLVHNGFAAPLFAMLIFGLAHRASAGRLLAHPRMVKWGELSFPMFVLHVPVGEAMLALCHALPPSVQAMVLSPIGRGQTWPFMALYVVVLLGLSWAVARFVEPPLHAWTRRRLIALLGNARVPALSGVVPGTIA